MNNQQFRNLLLNNSQTKDGSAGTPPTSRSSGSATPALGARKHSSIPMTPRQVYGKRGTVTSEFARQLAERNGKANTQRKFKSSVPKGVKLAAGFTDRTKERDDGEESEVAQRIKALEELMKHGQIDRETFERTVQEITGGDIAATHLVKGLDRKLLERVRQGERVQDSLLKREGYEGSDTESEIEEEFDELAEQDIAPVRREKVEKKGEKAPPPPVAGVKRSRDAILAELKAQRQAAAEAAAAEHEKRYPTLGAGFRKVGPNGESTRIEVDSRGREVLIITDADGKEKRKVRKQKAEQPELEPRNDIEDLKNPVKIPEVALSKPNQEESEEEDIFEGVGSNYNPLAVIEGEEDDDESSEDEKVTSKPAEAPQTDPTEVGEEPTAKSPRPTADNGVASVAPDYNDSVAPPVPRPRRNYFNDKPPSASEKEKDAADATVLAALKKVRTLDASSSLLQDTEEARLAKRAAELAAGDRDMEDMDLGFGASRFDDADEMDMEGEKVKFSEWKGLGAEDDEEDEAKGGRGAKKRKRGPKKKKGDKNNVADVLQAMERQKGTKTLG
jgi:hypothetical protein